MESEQTTNSMSTDPMDAVANLLVDEDSETPTEEQSLQSAPTSEDDLQDDDSDQLELEEDSESDDEDESESEEYSLADAAEVLGLSESDLTVDEDGNLLIKTKIDGVEGTVPLSELKKGYQMEAANTQRSQKLAEEKKQFEALKEQAAAQFEQKMTQTEGMMLMMQQELMQDYNSVNWDELRQLDPAEYTAKRYDFEQRQGRINQAAGYAQQMRDQKEEENQAKDAEILADNWKRMIENNPEWTDEASYKSGMGELKQFANTRYGFTDADFAQVKDARIIELLKDAKANVTAQSVVTDKKIKRKAPKLQRASNGRFVAKKRSKLDKLVKAAKSTSGANKRQLETEAVAELLMGG